MNATVTIPQLLNTPDGTYINSAVEGWLCQIRPANGKVPGKAKLQDGPASIDVTLWGGDCRHWEGKRVRFSGKGMKVTEFKGTKQLSVGDKVEISAAGGAPTGYSESMPGDPPMAPQPTQNRSAAPSHAPTAPNAESRIGEMTALYVECLKGARHVVSVAFREAAPEDTRNIATAFFIQATKEGLKAPDASF